MHINGICSIVAHIVYELLWGLFDPSDCCAVGNNKVCQRSLDVLGKFLSQIPCKILPTLPALKIGLSL